VFVPLIYRFFAACLVAFFVGLQFEEVRPMLARVFFVWVSVFNLFVVSVFWSFMADLFAAEQGKRLFGFIAAGGSAGALLGPAVTVGLAAPLGPVNLLIVAALLLEAAVLCVLRLERLQRPQDTSSSAPAAKAPQSAVDRLGGSWLAGIVLVLRSPYLAGIALWVALLSVLGTCLYFQQANIVAAASDDPAVRTRIFATIDLAVGILTILVQFCATGKLIVRFGVGAAAAFLPLVFGIGFMVLAFTPALLVVIAFQALQRTANFALSNPAREILFTVAGREEKYKAKNVIDGVVFRGSDAVAGWLFKNLQDMGLALHSISLVAVPLAALWFGVALALGRGHERRARL
jgi:AAA family ATP:ADP antiporter